MGKLSHNELVVTPESWDDIQEYIETFEHKAYVTVLALMVHNYTLHQFSQMGGYAFSAWKQEYLKDVN
tara:strand:+ start:738 stop:941 length:204 start_codon:yes stop_codon:yes gene_type:complete